MAGANGPHLSQSTAGEPGRARRFIDAGIGGAQALLSIDDTEGRSISSASESIPPAAKARLMRPPPRSRLIQRTASHGFHAQLELLAGRPAAYLQLATNELGPWAAANLEDRPQSSTTNGPDALRFVLANGVGLALSPLFDSAFTRQLPADTVAQAADSWCALRSRCHAQSAMLLADLVLRGLLPAERNQDRDELNGGSRRIRPRLVQLGHAAASLIQAGLTCPPLRRLFRAGR